MVETTLSISTYFQSVPPFKTNAHSNSTVRVTKCVYDIYTAFLFTLQRQNVKQELSSPAQVALLSHLHIQTTSTRTISNITFSSRKTYNHMLSSLRCLSANDPSLPSLASVVQCSVTVKGGFFPVIDRIFY